MSAKKENREVEPSEEREYHSPSSGIFFKIKRLLYRDKSDYQKIEVIENEYFGKVLLLDGLVQTTERDEFFYHEMLVHPAFVAHPSPQSILIIGGGDGGALKEILRYPIKYACLVEIDQQVVDISKEYFPWLQASLEDERTELVIADGVEFIEKTDKKFDIVFIDSSDPTGPSASLHERDFYEKLKRSLNLEGIVVSQEGSPFYHLDSIKKKNAFFKKLFKTACFYMSPVPTYPGGSWCFAFLSDEIKPLNTKRNPPQELKYFNHDVYQAAFSLPTFLKDLVSSA